LRGGDGGPGDRISDIRRGGFREIEAIPMDRGFWQGDEANYEQENGG
jgi:hypothetical protein